MRRLSLALLALLLAACAAERPVAQPTASPTVVQERVLNVYNWDTYIDPAVLSAFEREHDVVVNYQVYGNNEEMLELVESQAQPIDVVFPSDYMVTIMRDKGLLAPLYKPNVPNQSHLDPGFLNTAFDPGNRYCLPYQWGTMGIGYNRAAVGRDISSWADLFDPRFAGRVALVDDARSSLGAILLYLGYSPNTTNPAEIAEARDYLLAHADQIAAFAADNGQELLAAGEIDMAFEWSGDILQVMEHNPDVRYVIPDEGSYVWVDHVCVLAAARRPDLAELFINYLLDPQVGAAISNYTHFSSPNRDALPLIAAADRANPALYPPQEVRERLFYTVDVGPVASSIYNQAWDMIIQRHGR